MKSFSVTFTLTGVFTGESEDQVFWLFELVKTFFITLIRIYCTGYACSNHKCLRKLFNRDSQHMFCGKPNPKRPLKCRNLLFFKFPTVIR